MENKVDSLLGILLPKTNKLIEIDKSLTDILNSH